MSVFREEPTLGESHDLPDLPALTQQSSQLLDAPVLSQQQPHIGLLSYSIVQPSKQMF